MAPTRSPTGSNPKSKRPFSKRRPMREKQRRRKSTLIKKAREYSKMCEADVCLGIRIRRSGQVYFVSVGGSEFWAFLASQLVGCHALAGCNKTDCPGFPLSNADQDHRPGFGEHWEGYKCCRQARNILTHARYVQYRELAIKGLTCPLIISYDNGVVGSSGFGLSKVPGKSCIQVVNFVFPDYYSISKPNLFILVLFQIQIGCLPTTEQM